MSSFWVSAIITKIEPLNNMRFVHLYTGGYITPSARVVQSEQDAKS